MEIINYYNSPVKFIPTFKYYEDTGQQKHEKIRKRTGCKVHQKQFNFHFFHYSDADIIKKQMTNHAGENR